MPSIKISKDINRYPQSRSLDGTSLRFVDEAGLSFALALGKLDVGHAMAMHGI